MRVGRDGGVCALRSKLGGALQHNQCSDSGRPRREDRGIPRLGLRFGERLRADYSPKEESPGQGVAQFEAAPRPASSPWDTSVFVPRFASQAALFGLARHYVCSAGSPEGASLAATMSSGAQLLRRHLLRRARHRLPQSSIWSFLRDVLSGIGGLKVLAPASCKMVSGAGQIIRPPSRHRSPATHVFATECVSIGIINQKREDRLISMRDMRRRGVCTRCCDFSSTSTAT